MTTDETLEAIEALPDWVEIRASAGDSDIGEIERFVCSIADLKQLAADFKQLREFVGAVSELLTHAHRIEFPLPDKNGDHFCYFTSIRRYLGNPTQPDYNKWQSGMHDEVYDSPLDAFKTVMDAYGDRIRQIPSGTDAFDAWQKIVDKPR